MKQCIGLCLCLALIGCESGPAPNLQPDGEESDLELAAGKTQVDKVELQVFLPAGDVAGVDAGGNLVLCSDANPCPLEPGTFYPPTNGSHSILHRGSGWVSYNLHTTGLPPGAYTNWWVIFNNPDACMNGCDVEDVFDPNSEADVSVFWADGSIVGQNGVGNFHARIREGEVPGEFILGNPDGLIDAMEAEVHFIVKYHGPPSDDPDVLHEQLNTLLGSCDQGVNGFDDGGIIQCFDPQFAAHPVNK
jgi:hypothetical protein